MTEQENTADILDYFVLREPREKQLVAVDYIQRKYHEGYRHVVISAPTGIGKSAIGATACFWINSVGIENEEFEGGGYYLVTQKMLQDQLANDFKNYTTSEAERRCRSIKSSAEYSCEIHGNCSHGLSRKVKCGHFRMGDCSYVLNRGLWQKATLSVTNYPYLFTEHSSSGMLKPRRILVLDECHTLERQILKFVEITLSQSVLHRWTPLLKTVPVFDDVSEFSTYLLSVYLPELKRKVDEMTAFEDDDPSSVQEKLDLDNHYGRTFRAAALIKDDPDNWVFWEQKDRHDEREAVAKPLDAAPFAQELVFEMGYFCLHMSAYPGSKQLYCESLGLEPEKVAWFNMNSTFPIKNREIYLTLIGSMSRRNRERTLPELIEFTVKIMESYDTKGIIHCNSYELGELIYSQLKNTNQGHRLLFPRTAESRDDVFTQHRQSKIGTVILSPSMTEGFDFAYDLARWQIIAKVPYPYLGDLQVSAKKERNPKWYDLEAVKSIIQACGRIVRSDTDDGHTYILDSDFLGLWEKCQEMFPRWWTDALVWPNRK